MKEYIPSRNLVIVVCVAVAVAAVIIAGGLIIEHQWSDTLQSTFGLGAASSPAVTASTTSSSSPSSPVRRGGYTVTPKPPFTITILAPASGDAWKVGNFDSISWSRAANITGEIDLLDAVTRKFVGVITSNTGPQQTSYSWDTRQIYLERYGALKKDIVPGTYIVQMQFDGNNLPDITSGAVTIK
ncbi:MAG: hypothetical protein P4L99_07895 [Chthoniobacter sp.]|nr:hypothetical protein [Chthoniobacter sp.]